jgi:hypothetical protein
MVLRVFVMLFSLCAIPLAAVTGSGAWPRAYELLHDLRQQAIERLIGPALSASGPETALPSVLPDYIETLAPVAVQPLPPAPVPVVHSPTRPSPPFWPGVEQPEPSRTAWQAPGGGLTVR